MSEFKPFNQETDPLYNREGGIVVIPGSNMAKEMEKFEQFPSKWGSNPGNPYRYREYPRMLYRAEMWNGKICCMAAPPDPSEFAAPGEWQRKEELARKFTEKCQLVVNDDRELQRAMESGWRKTAQEAVEYLMAREEGRGVAHAERNWEDRNMSPAAKTEAAAVNAESGRHLEEIPEKPRKRRGRPPKNPVAA